MLKSFQNIHTEIKMIKLVAISPEDASALFQENGKTFFFRTSMREPKEVADGEYVVMNAVCREDYWAEDKVFADIDDLRDFLKKKCVETRKLGYYKK